jgi:threonine/homoserine/homoserine lactone efflux protein
MRQCGLLHSEAFGVILLLQSVELRIRIYAVFNWLSFLIYSFATTFSPGPNNILSMTYAGKIGFRKSYPFNIGILIGRIITMALCALCSSILYMYIPKIQMPMKIAGAAYLLYLAWRCLRFTMDTAAAELKATVLSGILLQFINAKAYIAGINVMSSFILPYYRKTVVIMGFALLFALIAFSATICWGLFGTVFRGLFVSHRKPVNICMAVLLVYCAASLFL